MGVAAGEEVEGVGHDGEDGGEALDGAAGRAGQVADQRRAGGAAHAPRTSIPKPRPSASLARRIASARPGAGRSRTRAVPSGVRSRGPKPVPPVVTTRPANPAISSVQRGGDGVDAVRG